MRTTRSTQALAQALRQKALARLPAVESLDAELNKHAAALGLDGARPRIVTSRIVRTLLAQLSAASDPTANLRVLAAADLPRENAIYRVHIDSAVELTGELRGLNWRVLDEFATSGDPQGTAILAPLRDAARREEHEIQLARPLRRADSEALDLVLSRQREPAPAPTPIPAPAPGATSRRVLASEVPSVVEEICDAADANQDAEFEITWRVVPK